MIVCQNAEIKTYNYPFADKLNPILHKIILEKSVNIDKGAVMTDWKFFVEEFQIISNWASNIIKNFERPPSEVFDLKLIDLWGQYYGKGHHQTSHDHPGFHWVFCYYVNVPKRSSPLVFTQSNKKIFPKPGMLIIFPGWVKHHVPPQKSNELRSVIAGNFSYVVDWEKEKKIRNYSY